MAGAVWESDQAAVVAFRGTDPWSLRDWLRDAETRLQDFHANPDLGKVHGGFVKALGSLGKPLTDALALPSVHGKPLWVTGHSLGGAMAVLFAARRTLLENLPVHGLYTFGQPRVGDPVFARAVDNSALGGRYFTIINGNDPAPHCPTRRRYADCGTSLQIDASGRLRDGLSPAGRWLQTLIIARRYLQSAGPDAIWAHARTAYSTAMADNIDFVPRS